MKKVGIISDIHASLAPLEKALTLLHSHHVDQIVCAGDLVDGGSDGDAVVNLMITHRIPCVIGNHDKSAFGDQGWLRKQLRMNRSDSSLANRLLNSYTVAYVAALPQTRYFEWEGSRVCLAHGSPSSPTTYLFPHGAVERIQQAVKEAEADILILGHTHIPMVLQYEGVWLFNPGSVYGNRDSERRTCAILTLPELQFEVFDIETGEQIRVTLPLF
jgi:putative phosphoesterase